MAICVVEANVMSASTCDDDAAFVPSLDAYDKELPNADDQTPDTVPPPIVLRKATF